jgi:hypothetical protein
MKFRLMATIVAVLASAHTARAQAMFPPETDNAALRYWIALAEVREPPDDDATRHLFGETDLSNARRSIAPTRTSLLKCAHPINL